MHNYVMVGWKQMPSTHFDKKVDGENIFNIKIVIVIIITTCGNLIKY